MRTFEDKLAPPTRGHAGLDIRALLPLMVITAFLLPRWSGPADAYVTDVAAQVASPYLLAAMGMMLAMRMGVLDLSVWMTLSAGGLAAAALIIRGVSPWLAFLTAAALGGLIGTLNGFVVVGRRWPSLTATAGVGLFVFVLLQAVVPTHELVLPDGAFEDWLITAPAQPTAEGELATQTVTFPLGVTQSILIAGVYSLVMAMLLTTRHTGRRHARRARWLVLIASGALSAMGGACVLLDHGSAFVPQLPFDDLRIPAAVLLAGTAALGGPGRTMMAGFCLPIAMLAATMWRMLVWPMGSVGIEWQMVLLVALALMITLAVRYVRVGRTRRSTATAYGLTLLAIAGLALGALVHSHHTRTGLRYLATVVAIAAALRLTLTIRRRKQRRS